MATLKNRGKLLCVLTYSAVIAADNPNFGNLKPSELNESFMRSLSKQQCMEKAIESFKKGCNSDTCLKNMAGITGDCTSDAKGDREAFCRAYERSYLGEYCDAGKLNQRQCSILGIHNLVYCKAGEMGNYVPSGYAREISQAIRTAGALDYFSLRCDSKPELENINRLANVLKEKFNISVKPIYEIAGSFGGITARKVQLQIQSEVDEKIAAAAGGCANKNLIDVIDRSKKIEDDLIVKIRAIEN